METEYERLRKKVENFPSASSYNRLAELCRLSNDNAGAEEWCQRCFKLFPRNGQAFVILAEIRLGEAKRAEALQLLTTAVERDPRSYAGLRLLSDLSAQDGNVPQALGHLRQILTFKPNDPGILNRIAELERGSASGSRPAAPGTLTPSSTAPAAPAAAAPVAADQAALTRRVGGAAPAPAPAPGALTGAVRAAGSTRGAVLDALCAEAGVRGAAVVDASGRVLMGKNLPPGQDELVAALSAEVSGAAATALGAIGIERCSTWVFSAAHGQVLAFARDKAFTVVALADAGVRPAMLELRARQALIDLGAA